MATNTERFGFTLPSGQDPASIIPLNLNTQNIEKYLGMTQDMLAPLYDATEGTYEVDNIVTHDSVLYKCIEDVETPEEFDETKWVQTTAVSEGGGASNVEANPTGTPTDTLSTIGIDGTIYGIEGSGGGDGYKLEKIFDGNVTTAGNITLNKSISNYDELLFVLNFTRELGESYITTFNVDVSIFKNIGNYTAARGVLLNDWSKDSRFAQVKYVDDMTIDVDAIQVVSIVEIYGVKLEGSGGGSISGEGVEIYSESEYIVGKWIDGKKLYQKSIKFSATSLSTNWMTIEQGVDYNLAFPEVQGLYYTDNGEPFTQSTRVFVQNGELKIQPLKELDLLSSTLKHVITIRYTKTVETPAPAWGGSVTNNYANFIDTDNVIYSTVSSSSTDTYTATEDCYIMQDVVTGSSVATVQIDSETVAEYSFSGTTMLLSYNTYLKKGQTIAVTHGATSAHTIKVFGITYASGGSSSGSSVEYSTEEKEVGTWIDGSKIYQKTMVLTNLSLQQGSNNFELSTFNISNVQYVIEQPKGFLKVNASDIRTYPFGSAYSIATYATPTKLVIERTGNNLSLAELTVTIRYTKAVS